MTERFEITSVLQRELVNDPAVFGEPVAGHAGGARRVHGERAPPDEGGGGSAQHPAGVVLRHRASRARASTTSARTWSTSCSGPCFRTRRIDYRRDVKVLAAQRWPTDDPRSRLPARDRRSRRSRPRCQRTSRTARSSTTATRSVTYRLRGTHVTLNVIWDWEAPEGGGDTHFARYRGALSAIEVRQTRADGFRPELYVVAGDAARRRSVRAALERKIAALQRTYPGDRRGRTRRAAARRHPRYATASATRRTSPR